MKLENQVVSLELAQKLKKLGVKQDSLFYWKLSKDKKVGWYIVMQNKKSPSYEYQMKKNERFSTFTVAEIGEILPAYVEGFSKHGSWLGIEKIQFENTWKCNYADGAISHIDIFGKTMADAMAKILIYLLENKLITL